MGISSRNSTEFSVLQPRSIPDWDKLTSLNLFPHLEKKDIGSSHFYWTELLHRSNIYKCTLEMENTIQMLYTSV